MDLSEEEQHRLQAKLNEPALTLMDKKMVLDARDKLLRLKQDRQTDLAKAVALVGTCPDMCPEQERYFRIETNQVSPFEMDLQKDGQLIPVENRMVKEYRRSGADQEEPLPHELRPIDVLERTMNYLCLEIVNQYETTKTIREWYDFIWSRTRSIRKDITQQHLIDLRSVALIEKCARFHIFCSYYLCEENTANFDPKINRENLNNCLQTLKDFYSDLSIRSIHCPNEPEFRAYDILLNLKNSSELKHIKNNIKCSDDVVLATKLYLSYNGKNYIKFFKYARQADFFKSCLLNQHFNEFRFSVMEMLCKAFTAPNSKTLVPFSVNKFIKLLAFDDFEELSYFLDNIGITCDQEYVYLKRNQCFQWTDNLRKRSINLVMNKLTSSLGIAIMGLDPDQQPSPSTLITTVHSSFDKNNKLLYDMNDLQIVQIASDDNFFKSKESDQNSKITRFDDNNAAGKTFSFNSQIDKIFAQENQIAGISDSNPFTTFNFNTENIPKELPKSLPTIDYKRIFNEIKDNVYESVLKENVEEICKTQVIRTIMEQIIYPNSKKILEICLSSIIKQILYETFTQQKRIKYLIVKNAKNNFESIFSIIFRSFFEDVYSDIKLKSKIKKNILLFSKQLYDEIFINILKNFLKNILSNEIRYRDEQIKTWRIRSLEKKYWPKWRRYYLSRKRYKFYRETFPAAPPSSSTSPQSKNSTCKKNLFFLKNSNIDDIRLNDCLKRKLTHSKFSNDIAENHRFIEQNLKQKKSRIHSDIEQMDREYFLQRKYFKLWFKRVYFRKNRRLRREFPSAPSSMMNISNYDDHWTLSIGQNRLTVIDPLISKANQSIKSNLLKKLNYDFDSTVELIRKTLDDRQRRRTNNKTNGSC